MLIVSCAIIAEFIKVYTNANYVVVAIIFVAVALLIICFLYRNEIKNIIFRLKDKLIIQSNR